MGRLCRFKSTRPLLLPVRACQSPERKVNMNEAGDDHISFAARHLALSPDGRRVVLAGCTAGTVVDAVNLRPVEVSWRTAIGEP